MSSKLPLVLIVGGLLIAGISWFGYQNVNTKSDTEVLYEAMQDMREAEEQAAEDRVVLMKKVLPVPPSCATITVKSVFDICEAEPSDAVSWPNWALMATPEEQTCLLDTFYQTNAHAYAIQGEPYEQSAPSNAQMGNFACDVFGGVLWSDSMNYDDPNQSITELITSYYKDRSESRVTPGHAYQ